MCCTQGAVEMKITQNDVRAIQLAKAALYAGIALLMERLGIDRTSTASASPARSAATSTSSTRSMLGMVPDCDLAHVRSAGNAAGTGARIALLDATSRGVIEGLVRRIEKVETAIEPRFQHHFVEAMAIPHKSADVPESAQGRRSAGAEGIDQPERNARPAAAARARPEDALSAARSCASAAGRV